MEIKCVQFGNQATKHYLCHRNNKNKELCNSGEDIILKSRKNGSFKLVPVSEHDTLISKEYILEPDADFERAITMDELLQGVKADIHEMFKNKQKRG